MRGQNKAADIAAARRPHSEVVRLLRQGERPGQRQLRSLPGGRDPDPDLPPVEPLGRALLRQGLGARLQGRGPLRLGGREDDLADRGRSGDRQHLRSGLGGWRLRPGLGRRSARHRHLPAAGRERRGLHADGLAHRGRQVQADRRELPGRRPPPRRRARRQGDPGRPRALAAEDRSGLRQAGLPATPERLALRRRAHRQARAAAQRRPLRPRPRTASSRSR